MPVLTRASLAALTRAAGEPVDGSSLAVFRIAFGLLLAHRAWADLRDGWIDAAYVEPQYVFPYPGFEWLPRWPGTGLHLHVAVVAVAALFVAAGAAYRLAAGVLAVGLAYLFLLDEAQYLNHDYLIVLFAALLVLVPADRALAWDARGGARSVPRGALWLLRSQMGLVYSFAGVAKLDADWLAGAPMHGWLLERADLPLVGALLAQPATAVAMSGAGMLVDLCAWPALSHPRSRPVMFGVLVAFHLVNSQLFSIGVFPWLSLAATSLFFAPDWPQRFLRISRWSSVTPVRPPHRAWWALASAYLAVQLLVPLRHHLYPGPVSWTEEGHRFAWHMLLRHKDTALVFLLRDRASGAVWEVAPDAVLTEEQAEAMASRPYMIQQLAVELRRRARIELGADVEVYANAWASLNGRPWQRLIDPSVDLARVPDDPLAHAPWIVPLEEGSEAR